MEGLRSGEVRPPYYYSAQLSGQCSRVSVRSKFCSQLAMGFCSCSVRYLLFIFNFIVVLCGIGIIVIGVLSHSSGGSLRSILSGQVTATTITLITLGAIIFIIAFFGCCGAIRDSPCMLTTYAIFLLTIIVIQVAIGVLAFVYKAQFQDAYAKAMQESFDSYNENSETRDSIDRIQRDFQCCGPTDPSYWTTGPPSSCCRDPKNTGKNCETWSAGCIQNTKNFLKKTFEQLGGVAIAVAVIECFGVIFGFCLARSIRRHEKRGYV